MSIESTDLRLIDSGEAYMAAVAEYVVRGGSPDDVLARCPVCEQVNVGPGHRTPLGHECPFGRPRDAVSNDPNTCPACHFGDRRVPHTTSHGRQCAHVPEPSAAEARLLSAPLEAAGD